MRRGLRSFKGAHFFAIFVQKQTKLLFFASDKFGRDHNPPKIRPGPKVPTAFYMAYMKLKGGGPACVVTHAGHFVRARKAPKGGTQMNDLGRHGDLGKS